MPKNSPERKERSKADKELWAMGAVTRALCGLSVSAQARVLDWAQQRLVDSAEAKMAPLSDILDEPSGHIHPSMDND